MQLSAPLSALLSGGSIIDLDGTIFVQLGLFILAFLILRGFVFGPTMRVLEAREEAIDGSQAEAKKIEANIAEQQGNYDAQMLKVRTTADGERQRLRGEGQETERQVLEKVRSETTAMLAEAQARLNKEADAARAELKVTSAVLATEIAAKVLGREVKA